MTSSNEAFVERLRRMRRESFAHDREAPPAPPLPAWLTTRLSRARDPAGAAPPTLAGCSAGLPERLCERASDHGTYAARTSEFSATYAHGDFRLAETRDVDARAFGLLTGDARLKETDLDDAVFLDTETTGLGGGAGVHVFLIGLGRFTGDSLHGRRFELWQGFLRGPHEERALLAEAAARIAGAGTIVTFFGKSFDRHRLEDKMHIHGVAPPFAERRHLDLYHPLARLTRGSFGDARLQTLEAELTGVERACDLPGAFAPEAWFDFLMQRPHRLEGVFQHNLDDVLSLVTLAAYLGRVLAEKRANGAPLRGSSAARARAIAEAALRARDASASEVWLETAIARAPAGAARDLELQRAERQRRAGLAAEAQAAFSAFVEAPEDVHTAQAMIGFAKLLEHQLGLGAQAIAICERAIGAVERWHLGAARARLLRDLECRLRRLRLRHRRG